MTEHKEQLPPDYWCGDHPDGPHRWRSTGHPRSCELCGYISPADRAWSKPSRELTADEELLFEIRMAIPAARARAARVGSLHALWDVISDADDALAGRKTVMPLKEILTQLGR